MVMMKWKQEQSQCRFAEKITHLGCLMIAENYLQGSIVAYPFSPLKRLTSPTKAWELTQMVLTQEP